jgi:Protein of unknown function (DUF3151)
VTELHITEPNDTRIEEPAGSLDALAGAGDTRAVAARYPECLAAWAALGAQALDGGRAVEAYAYFRVGYHRGLDRIRAAGWRGAGRVPWAHEGNRGFLRALGGLGDAAEALGERSEASRCRDFLAQLAPDRPE